MSTPASSLNWWYIDGSRRLTSSAGRRLAMSRNTPTAGEPRPSLTSLLIALATSSRGSSSGGRRLLSGSLYQPFASYLVNAYCLRKTTGTYLNMNRLPLEFLSTPPSQRTDSVTRMPLTEGGQTMPVGWNWRNSMLISVAPARRASAWPSPVYSQEFDVTLYDRPTPPGASPMAGASKKI